MPAPLTRKYQNRIIEEEKMSREAASPGSALAHHQVAMLYKTELAIIRRKRATDIGETLADIW